MKYFILFVFLICISPALAQDLPGGKSDAPLEITADDSLEWHRTEKTFIAKKNALAKQGETNIAAQTLTAHYREDAKGKIEIVKLTAEDQVIITSNDTTAYGKKAVYDLDSGLATMTGNNLKMTGPDQTVTAQDRFEYWINDSRLSAIGRAKVTRLEDTIEADTVSAIFTEDESGARVLHSMEAIGNVVITTPTEIITGSHGIYHSKTNIAELSGGVQIKRGPNILEGAKAQVNLNTNVSKMYGSAQNGGRVRGIFYPGSEEKPGVN